MLDRLYLQGIAAIIAQAPAESGDGTLNPIAKFFNIILELISPISSEITTIGALVILISGALLALPTPKRFKEKAYGYLIFLIIGGILMAGAAQYANYINSKIQF